MLKFARSLNPLINLNNIWYDNRYWSKVSFSTIITPGHDLQVTVMDLEILRQNFTIELFKIS